jgi:nucleoside-diphosphate-sugar epimerase
LVYGERVGANFRRLMHWVHRGIPLPFGAVCNRRSLVSVWNLCDLLNHLLSTPLSRSTWLVSDGEDLSTPDLIVRLGVALHRRARLIPVPVPALRLLGRLAGRAAELDRLCGSLVVDITPAKRELGWTPPVSVDEGLLRTAAWYLSEGLADA